MTKQRGASLDKGVLGTEVRLVSASGSENAVLARSGRGCRIDAQASPCAGGWVIRAARDAPGTYVIEAARGGGVLGADSEGRDVETRAADDGSGRQRWVFEPAGDSGYVVRLAGGQRDGRVYLGVREDSTVRLFAEEKGLRTQWRPSPANPGAPPPQPPVPVPLPLPAAPAGTTRVPKEVVPELTKITSMTEKDVDVILQLISLPENSTPQWWTNYNYIEFLGDGRGFTVTLYGACSGTGDLAMIFDELAGISPRSAKCEELLAFRGALKKKRGDDITGIEPIKKIIRGLGEDSAWQQAVWKVYVKLYWRFAMDWADKRGDGARRPGPVLRLPATRGFMVDTAINHGADFDSLMDVVKRMKDPRATDEVAWATDFAEARRKMLKSGYQDLDTSKSGDRCELWKPLFTGNPGLKPPFKAFKGYWGAYSIQ